MKLGNNYIHAGEERRDAGEDPTEKSGGIAQRKSTNLDITYLHFSSKTGFSVYLSDHSFLI